MPVRVRTGGQKEFVYEGNEKYRDTHSTKEFKEAYNKWINRPVYKRKMFWIGIILLIVIIFVYIRFYLFKVFIDYNVNQQILALIIPKTKYNLEGGSKLIAVNVREKV